MNLLRYWALLIFLPAVFSSAIFAQSTAPKESPTAAASIKDPAELLALGAKVNGLHSPDLKPWHIRASVRVEYDKATPLEGTLEEWWAGENKYKIVYSSKGFQHTSYGTDRGVYSTGNADGLSPPLAFAFRMTRLLINGDLPSPSTLESMKPTLERTEVKIGDMTLECVIVKPIKDPGVGSQFLISSPDGPIRSRYCFNGDPPSFRTFAGYNSQTTFNSVVLFQGQYLARHIRLSTSGDIDIHLDLIEKIATVADADFMPPADAVPDREPVQMPSGVMAGYRIAGKTPQYPYIAKSSHLQGSVVLDAVIHKDGSIGDLKIVSGPPMLQQAALDAAKTWQYRPYLVNGEAVEVSARFRIVFSLDEQHGGTTVEIH